MPQLVAHTVQDAEPCYIESNGKAVAVLVSLRQWQQRMPGDRDAAPTATPQERHLRAYQHKMQQLGPDYWLPAAQQARLQELVEKADRGPGLTPAERKELCQLLKRHEQMMIKRAAAMHALR